MNSVNTALTIWMKHLGDEPHCRWLVWILFSERYCKFECAIFKRCIMWPANMTT